MIVRPLIFIVVVSIASMARADTLKLGWTAWSDAIVMSRMAKAVIEANTPHRVKLVLADIGIQYSGIASGDLDFMMMSWQPETHRDYLDKFKGRYRDLGVLYSGARLGWAVPAYIPESVLRSIPDLARPDVETRLGWRIQGIDAGAGITRLSEAALKIYGLHDYQLQYASGAGMVVALSRAIRRHHWIVITAWRPHWIFGKFKLRFLDDPKAALGRDEAVHVIARIGFRRDYPRVAAALSRMHFSLPEVEGMMLEGERSSYRDSVRDFIRTHPDRIAQWFGGVETHR